MSASEIWMLLAIFVMLFILAFLAVAETALNRISRVKAQAIADSRGTKSARALQRLVTHPERFINPLLVTITVLQMGQAFLTSLLANDLFGHRVKVVHGDSSEADYLVDNPNRRCPDITKARTELQYRPGVTLTEGLRRTMLWYSGNRSGEER